MRSSWLLLLSPILCALAGLWMFLTGLFEHGLNQLVTAALSAFNFGMASWMIRENIRMGLGWHGQRSPKR